MNAPTWLPEYRSLLKTKHLKLLETPAKKTDKVSHKCLLCEHTWSPRINNIRINDSGCPQCELAKIGPRRLARCKKLFLQKLKEANLKNLTPYVDNITPMFFECMSCDNSFEYTPAALKRRGIRCDQCIPNIGKSFSLVVRDRFFALLKRRNYALLSEYKGISKKVTLKCHCGAEWCTPPFSITSINGCPNCAVKRSYSYKQCKIQGKILNLQGHEDLALHWLVAKTNLRIKKLSIGKGRVRKFEYRYKGNIRTYNPDFEINKSIIEVKSTYTAGLLGKKVRSTDPDFIALKAKAKAVIDAGYRFHLLIFRVAQGRILKATVPKDWLQLKRIELAAQIRWSDITEFLPIAFRRNHGYQ